MMRGARLGTFIATCGLAAGCVADTAGLEALGALDVAPAEIAFGTLGGGCEPFERPVTVRNDGDATVVIEEIRLERGGPFSIVSLPAPLPDDPLELRPRTQVSVVVRFDAAADGVYEDALEVRGRIAGAAFTETVELSGRVAADGVRVDTHRQNAQADADVLFVVDDSPSMTTELRALTRAFPSFIEVANTGFLSYQVGLTSSDVSDDDSSANGRLLPLDAEPEARIVTRASAPSPATRFERNGAALGTEDSAGLERGLEAMRRALSPELLSGHNFGLVREQANLSVILISDEQDQSPPVDLDVYEAALLALKGGDRDRVTVSAVVAPLPNGCSGPDGQSFPAPRYIELARRLGGVIESICTSNWPEVLSRISSTAFGLRARFALAERPGDPEGIVVRVDGAPIERLDDVGLSRWRYQASSNSVVFVSRYIPGPGALVEIEYDTGCDGEEGL